MRKKMLSAIAGILLYISLSGLSPTVCAAEPLDTEALDGESWDMECQLLAQDIYRRELFSADEYAEQYAERIEEALSDQVVAFVQAGVRNGNKPC